MLLHLLFFISIQEVKADAPPMYSRIDSPCTSSEKWTYGGLVPKGVRKSLENLKHGKDDAIDGFITGYTLQSTYSSGEIKYIAEYVIYRAYYDIGLIHLANRGFNSLAALPTIPESTSMKLAALGCLNSIHHTNPALRLNPELPKAFASVNINQIWPDQRKQLWESVLTIAQRKLIGNWNGVDLNTELAILNRSGPYLILLQANMSAVREDDENAIKYTKMLLDSESFPKSFENQKDALYLNLARSYYDRRNYPEAIKYFKKVNHKSNLLTQTILGQAWTYLAQGRPNEASGEATNLLVGGLRNTFAPDAPIITAIGYVENCQYKEALMVLDHFRRTYASAYRWLYDSYNLEKAGRPKNYYTLLADALNRKTKSPVPKTIIAEWTRSPIFLTLQQEINLIYDEQQIARDVYKKLTDPGKSKDRTAIRIKQGVYRIISSFIKETGKIQQNITTRINYELKSVNLTLISFWISAYENSQLTEIEIYNNAGETLSKSQHKTKMDAGKPTQTQKDNEGLPVLDWGKVNLNDSENIETWDDEAGYIRAAPNNLCAKKK